jgi:raffinose/stachyose/melibiose transport system substrate-binding protein
VPLAIEGDVGDYDMLYFQYLVERIKGKGFLLSAIEDKTGQKWSDPVFTQVMTMIQDLWAKGYIPPASQGYKWPAAQQTLALGKAAMELCGGWLPNELSPITGSTFNWGGFSFPSVAGGAGKVTDLQRWLISFGIVKGTQHPQEAELFLKFVMTKDSQTRLTQAMQGVTRTGVTWPAAMADGQVASAAATLALDHADGGTALHAEYTANILFADYMKAFLGTVSIPDFITKLSADSKTYWSSH